MRVLSSTHLHTLYTGNFDKIGNRNRANYSGLLWSCNILEDPSNESANRMLQASGLLVPDPELTGEMFLQTLLQILCRFEPQRPVLVTYLVSISQGNIILQFYSQISFYRDIFPCCDHT